MSRFERDAYIKGRRLSTLGESTGLLIAAEFAPDVPTSDFASRVTGVVEATRAILVARDISIGVPDINVANWAGSGRGRIDSRRPLSIAEVADRAAGISTPKYRERVDELLENPLSRTRELSNSTAALIRSDAREDTVDLYLAPEEVFAYYISQRESNNESVKIMARAVLGVTAVSAYANKVDFEPIAGANFS